jgi:hypothetical protein
MNFDSCQTNQTNWEVKILPSLLYNIITKNNETTDISLICDLISDFETFINKLDLLLKKNIFIESYLQLQFEENFDVNSNNKLLLFLIKNYSNNKEFKKMVYIVNNYSVYSTNKKLSQIEFEDVNIKQICIEILSK